MAPAPVFRSAHRVIVRAEWAAVFGFLAELSNHWQLMGETIESFESRMDGAGAVLHMRAAPLPIRRTVKTEIVAVDEPLQIRGFARSRETTASIIWRLQPVDGDGTCVTLTVLAQPVGIVDKLIVRVGDPWWRSRYRAALRNLSAEFGVEGRPWDCDVPSEHVARELSEMPRR